MATDNPITATYLWTVDEVLAAHANHERACCRRPFRVALAFIGVLSVFAGVLAYSSKGLGVQSVLFSLVGAYILFLRKVEVRAEIRRSFRRRPDRDLEAVVTMTDDELRIKTDRTDYRCRWDLILKVRRARNGLLLYPFASLYYWLPFHAFSDESQRDAAVALLRAKIGDFKEIT